MENYYKTLREMECISKAEKLTIDMEHHALCIMGDYGYVTDLFMMICVLVSKKRSDNCCFYLDMLFITAGSCS